MHKDKKKWHKDPKPQLTAISCFPIWKKRNTQNLNH